MENTTRSLRFPSVPWLARAVVALAVAALLAGCSDDGGDGGDLQWFTTCGDPACGGYTPTPGATLCTDEAAGDPCAPEGTSCEIPDDPCNTDLMCAAQDPAVNCPISRVAAKRAIRYVSPDERRTLRDALLAIRLATYQYRSQPGDAKRSLGFLIEDVEAPAREPGAPAMSPAIRGDGQRVDLYGFTSMAVAAVQEQAAEIAELRAALAALSAEVRALRADVTPSR